MKVSELTGTALDWAVAKCARTARKENTMHFTLRVNARESYTVRLVEVCPPRSRWDTETHRVMLTNGNILRVCPSQLRPA